MTRTDNTANIDSKAEETDFGFRSVPKQEKQALVRSVFDSVASRYDVMNDLMSLGIHRIWKKIFLTKLDPQPHQILLDLAAGTGDITSGWLSHGGTKAIMTDINEQMLSKGRNNIVEKGLATPDVAFCVMNGEQLPLSDMSVDRMTMAFGLRNCTDKMAVLKEAFRVLRPGGRFLCLEFSQLKIAALTPLYEQWCFKILPLMGRVIAKDSDSYQYLAESIRMFPDQQKLASMFSQAGFSHVGYQNLSGGIVAIHSGWRI